MEDGSDLISDESENNFVAQVDPNLAVGASVPTANATAAFPIIGKVMINNKQWDVYQGIKGGKFRYSTNGTKTYLTAAQALKIF